MTRPARPAGRAQRGIVLITSILLLVVITLMALGMFKSFGLQERIAGNMREKHRALQAAITAEEYAEWYLVQPGNALNVVTTCTAGVTAAVTATPSGQVCKNAINTSTKAVPVYTPPTTAQWTALGTAYCPPFGAGTISFMTAPAGCTSAAGVSSNASYYAPPQFYIQYLGASAGGLGSIFQIDAIAYGGTSNAVAEVRSTYLVSTGAQDLGAL